jgi:hypothetical protein
MTPEGKILAHAKKECKRLGLRMVRMSFGPGNETGWPDTLILGPEGSGGGLTMWLETKAPGKDLRPIQAFRFQEITDRGGMPRKADSEVDVTAYLEQFLSVCVYEASRHSC